MTPEAKQVVAQLGAAAQEVGGRVIASIDGRNQDIVAVSGELTEFGRTLLDAPAPAKRGRPAKAKAKAAEDLAADLRELGLGDAEDEGGEDE